MSPRSPDHIRASTLTPHWLLRAVGVLCLLAAAPVPAACLQAGALLTHDARRPPPRRRCCPPPQVIQVSCDLDSRELRGPILELPAFLYPTTREELEHSWRVSAVLAVGAGGLPLLFIPSLLRLSRRRQVTLHPNKLQLDELIVPLHELLGAHQTPDRRLLVETTRGVVTSEPFADNDVTLEWLVFELQRLCLDAAEAEAQQRAQTEMVETAEALASAARRGGPDPP